MSSLASPDIDPSSETTIADEVLQFLFHEYVVNHATYKRVFGNLSSPSLGRVEAIYPHKMHDVIIQILSCKGVVVKNITRQTTNAVIRKLGLDPQRKEIVYLDEFLSHVRPKLSYSQVSIQNINSSNPTLTSAKNIETPVQSWTRASSHCEVTASGDSNTPNANLRRKLSHIPVLQSYPNPHGKNSASRPPSSGYKSRSRNSVRKEALSSRDTSARREPTHLQLHETKNNEKNEIENCEGKSNSTVPIHPRPRHRRAASSAGPVLNKATDNNEHLQTNPYGNFGSRVGSRACIPSPVFNSLYERSSSLDQRRFPNASSSNGVSLECFVHRKTTVETGSQTLLTMELFTTNRNSIRNQRGKSQSPRIRAAKERDKDVASCKTERSSKERGDSFKKMLFKKIIPWKRISDPVENICKY